jgi:hypothetical protein
MVKNFWNNEVAAEPIFRWSVLHGAGGVPFPWMKASFFL